MRRSVATVSLLTFGWLTVPAAPAWGCRPPAPRFEADRAVVLAGGSLHVEGESRPGCGPTTPPPTVPTETETATETAEPSGTPSETPAPSESPAQSVSPTPTPSESPVESVSPTPTPSESPVESVSPTPTSSPGVTESVAPAGAAGQAFRPAPALRVAQQPVVRFFLAPAGTEGGSMIDTLPEEHDVQDGRTRRRSFDGTITVPNSTPAGRYRLSARGSVDYGSVDLVVGPSLPEGGARHTTPLLKVALMFGAAGVVAVAGGVAMARRT